MGVKAGFGNGRRVRVGNIGLFDEFAEAVVVGVGVAEVEFVAQFAACGFEAVFEAELAGFTDEVIRGVVVGGDVWRAGRETFSRGTIGAFERTLGRALLQLSYQEYLDR